VAATYSRRVTTRRTKLGIAALAALLLTAAVVIWGLAQGDRTPEEPVVEPLSTPLSELDTTTMSVTRGAFCDRLSPADVEAALGGEPQRAGSYGNGDRAAITPRVRDVAHEYACSWSGRNGTGAAAWVFAPPVTPAWAKELSADVPRPCRGIQAPAFGAASSAVQCGQTITFRGLFGDAWLTCSLTGTAQEQRAALVDRAGRWCATVALAAA